MLQLAEGFPQQQLQGGIRPFKLVALMFQGFDLLDNGFGFVRLPGHIQVQILRLGQKIALSGQLGYQHTLLVANQLGSDVLIGAGGFQNGGHMDAALMGKGGGSYKRLVGGNMDIGDFADKPGRSGETCQLCIAYAAVIHLQLKVRDH
ncbi:hypothetical protein D3C75_1023900 [compost metagenome]